MRTEAAIEREFCSYVEACGYPCLKLRIDGSNGFPDRTVLTKYGAMFLEFKEPGGGKISALQQDWIKALRRLGYTAEVVNSVEAAKRVFHDFLEEMEVTWNEA